MEKQATISSDAAALAPSISGKVSTRSVTVSKKSVAFLSDLPDDLILKCASHI
jgi:hypothetical protein